jgi:hypothetical protein
MATTLRLVTSESRSSESKPAPTQAPPSPTPITAEDPLRRFDARIKLESLPTPLRAAIRDRTANGITIEAELPWLSIGTELQAVSPDGTEYTSPVQSFDVEVTGTGSARLLIFAGPSPPTQPREDRGAPAGKRPRARRWPSLVSVAFVAAAALSGYVLGQRSSSPLGAVQGSNRPATGQVAADPATP